MKKVKRASAHPILRKILRIVLFAALGILLTLFLAAGGAVLTIDAWIVPAAAWYAGVEIEGEPAVSVSFPERRISISGLKLKGAFGQFTAKQCSLRVDDAVFDGLDLKELRVSEVSGEGVHAELDFSSGAADAAEPDAESVVSGESVRAVSRGLWRRASKPVLRVMDLHVRDASISWNAGASRTTITLPDLTAEFADGIPTRPKLNGDLRFRIADAQRSLQLGAHLSARESPGGESIFLNVRGTEPVVLDLPDAHWALPAAESTNMLVQFEPEALRFGGEWASTEPLAYPPLDIEFGKALFDVSGSLALRGEKLLLRCSSSAHASELICQGKSLPGDLESEAKFNVEFDLASGEVAVNSVRGHLSGGGGRIDLNSTGAFSFLRHEDGSYSFKPQPAALEVVTENPLNLTVYDPVLPFDSVGRQASVSYTLELDPEKTRLVGKAKADVRDEKINHSIFEVDAAFETDGITHIRGFNVTYCNVSFFDGKDRIYGGALTGKYDIKSAQLQGALAYYPYRILSRIGGPRVEDLCSFLKDAKLHEAEHTAAADLNLDLVNMVAVLNWNSYFARLGLTGSDGKNLGLAASGGAEFRLLQDRSTWQLKTDWDVRAGNDFHASGAAEGESAAAITGTVKVDRLSDVLMRQISHRMCPDSNIAPTLHFTNAFCSAGFQYNHKTSAASFRDFQGGIEAGEGRITISSPSELTPGQNGILPDAFRFKASMSNLPVSFLDAFIADPSPFGLAGGTVTAECSIESTEAGAKIRGEGMLVGKDLTILVDGEPREMGRAGLNGSFDFDAKTSILWFERLNIDIQDREKRQTLFASGSGAVDCANNAAARFKFEEVRLGPEFLYLIGYGAQHSFYFAGLDAAGAVDFSADQNFRELKWTGALKINKIQLLSDEPELYQFPVLSGMFEGELFWADSDMYGDVAMRLTDEAGADHVAGTFRHVRGSSENAQFTSTVLDLPLTVAYFRYNHRPDTGAALPENISLPEMTFDLDLQGIFSRKRAMTFSASGPLELKGGKDPVIAAPNAVFAGDAAGTASVEIHPKGGDWPFTVHADLRDIPVDKFFTAFLATDDSAEIPHDMHGNIKHFTGTITGRGFTTEALAQNLTADCRADLASISLRSSVRDRSLLLNALLLPLICVPRLIDYVPGEVLRSALRLATAGSVMDMITGDAPIEFADGVLTFTVSKGVLYLTQFQLNGPLLQTYSAAGTLDLAGTGGADLATNTRFAAFHWPVYLSGDINAPKVAYGKSVMHFFSDNTKYLIVLFPNMIFSAFSEEDAAEVDRKESADAARDADAADAAKEADEAKKSAEQKSGGVLPSSSASN